METCKSFDELWEKSGSPEEYAIDKNIIKFAIELNKLFEKRGVSKKELAVRMKTSKAYITRVFKGDANFTIGTMTKLVEALEGTIDIHVSPKEERNAQWFKVLGKAAECNSKKTRHWNRGSMTTITTATTSADDYQEANAG